MAGVNKMKIVINNDRKIPMHLRVFGVNDSTGDGKLHILKECEIKAIKIEIPEGCCPYIKIWENGDAFLSYIDSEFN